MKNPKVSIIIPVYNGSNYLREAIDSALAQTYKNIEIIVVNDGSKDNGDTEQIALSYGDKIRYFKKENGDVSSALNLGIRHMEGEYFSWLSHDDMYYPKKVQTQMEAILESREETKIVYSSWDVMTMPERTITSRYPEYRFSKEDRENGIIPVLFGLIHGCSMLIHKSHFERVGLFDETLRTSQDYDMWFRIFRNQKVLYLDEPLIISRTHAEQGSRTMEEFMSNCEDIQLDMVGRVERYEAVGLFGSVYQMLYQMISFAMLAKLDRCIQMWLPMLLQEEEPQGEDALTEIREKSIVLFCAGRNGRKLQEELSLYGIEVSNFSDNNEALWGSMINGIMCVAPSEIAKDACVIVTKDYPEDLVKELNAKGYEDVLGYDELVRKMFHAIPRKAKVERIFG